MKMDVRHISHAKSIMEHMLRHLWNYNRAAWEKLIRLELTVVKERGEKKTQHIHTHLPRGINHP